MVVLALHLQLVELLPHIVVAVEAVDITQIQHQRAELVAVVKGRKIQLALHLPQGLQTQVVVVAVVEVVENPLLRAVQAL
jgi:hypothetical protein